MDLSTPERQAAAFASIKEAILAKNLVEAKKLITSANINLQDPKTWQTALHVAAGEGVVELVKYFLKKKANVNSQDKDGWAPIHCACFTCRLNVIEVLLNDPDLDVAISNNEGTTPLHYFVRHVVSGEDAPQYLRLLQMIIDRGGSPYAQNKNGEFPLHSACSKGNSRTVRYLLQNCRVKPDLVNKKGETGLHYAVMAGKAAIVKIFLEFDADTNIPSRAGETPLDIAERTNQTEIIQMLRQGDNYTAEELHILSAVKRNDLEAVKRFLAGDVAALSSPSAVATNPNITDRVGMTPLHHACSRGFFDIVDLLLDDERVKINNVTRAGNSPLHYLARHIVGEGSASEHVDKYVRILTKLLDKGAVIDAANKAGETPLHLASLRGNERSLRILLERGANPDIASRQQETAMHYAIMAGKVAAVRLLLEFGADKTVVSQLGESPLDLAKKTHQAAVVYLLEDPNLAATATKRRPKKDRTDVMVISAPTNLVHRVHVDNEYNWSGDQDPAEFFELQQKLGDGAYASVYRAVHKETGFVVAIKVLTAGEEREDIKREIDILRKCRNTNIVQYFGCCFKDDKLWILMDYCGAGSVSQLVTLAKKSGKSLTEEQIAAILTAVLKGLVYLHNNGTIHRDMKAANILINDEGEPKIADFGVSAELLSGTMKAKTTIGTPLFMSPEVLDGSAYDTHADIWSLGITTIEMADGVPPHFSEHVMRAMLLISTGPSPTVKDPSSWSPEFNAFVAACVAKNPADRPTAAELLSHPFITAHLAKDHKAILKSLLEEHRVRLGAASPPTPAVPVGPAAAAAPPSGSQGAAAVAENGGDDVATEEHKGRVGRLRSTFFMLLDRGNDRDKKSAAVDDGVDVSSFAVSEPTVPDNKPGNDPVVLALKGIISELRDQLEAERRQRAAAVTAGAGQKGAEAKLIEQLTGELNEAKRRLDDLRVVAAELAEAKVKLMEQVAELRLENTNRKKEVDTLKLMLSKLVVEKKSTEEKLLAANAEVAELKKRITGPTRSLPTRPISHTITQTSPKRESSPVPAHTRPISTYASLTHAAAQEDDSDGPTEAGSASKKTYKQSFLAKIRKDHPRAGGGTP